MLPIKSFLPPNSMNSQNICNICKLSMLNSATCCYCGQQVCRNKCSYLILPQNAQNKPWLANVVGQNVCLNCMPKTSTASDNYIRKIFAEIFSNEQTEEDSKTKLSTEDDTNIEEYDIENTMDSLIGGILKDLKIHGRLILDENGNLSSQSKSDIFNSLKQLIINASTT